MATKNKGKIREVLSELKCCSGITFLSLNDFPDIPDIIEDGTSFQENALKKAGSAAKYTGETSLADDSGLEVDILGGKPGIYSSRYSGADATDEENIARLLRDLKDVPMNKRGAAFHCVLALCDTAGNCETFEGTLRGFIALEPKGNQGFGYDPVFFVPEFNKTVAEMQPDLKNRISHRGQALRALKNRLKVL